MFIEQLEKENGNYRLYDVLILNKLIVNGCGRVTDFAYACQSILLADFNAC